MRKAIIYIAAVITLGSCSDFLDVEPDLQISFDEQFSTQEGVLQIVSGIYHDTEALASSVYQTYPDYIGGNVAFTPRVSSREVTVSNLADTSYPFEETPNDSDFTSFYGNSYDVINQVNIVLDRLDALEFLTDQQKQQLRAELLAIRAVTHYQLSLLYAQNRSFTADGSHPGIVYNSSILEVGIDFPSRSTVAENYLSMQQDLETAITLFTGSSFLDVGAEISYFNEWNTKAIYARIALQMNDWQTAVTLSNDVILNSGVSLTSQADYIIQWLDTPALSETLLEYRAPQNSDGNTSSSISQYYLFNSATNYNDFSVSTDLINLYDATDARLQLYQLESIPTLTPTGITSMDYYFLNKYQADSGTPMIRISEVYLIYAEAQERLAPGDALALSRLNEIRERANLNAITSSNDLLEDIFIERRRELAFENSLFYDIARYQKNVERNDGCIANVCNLNYPSNFYVLPIPIASILNNENMIQNEGY